MSKNETFLILGGTGLVGWQTISDIVKNLSPKKITIAALQKDEAEQTLAELHAAFSHHSVQWDAVWGNFFVRTDYAHLRCEELFHDEEKRENMYQDLFACLDAAYENSYLVKLIQEQQADVIIDNLDLGSSMLYQDIYTNIKSTKNECDTLIEAIETNTIDYRQLASTKEKLDILLLSQALPQLIRHIQLLYRAMVEAKTGFYIKIDKSIFKQQRRDYLFQVAINSAYQGLVASLKASFEIPIIETLKSDKKLSEFMSKMPTKPAIS